MTGSAWLDSVLGALKDKMPYITREANACDFIPYTTRDGRFTRTDIQWWTNGFWPAQMWLMFRLTGDSAYRDAAVCAETMLDAALRDFEQLHHDVGFMWLIQSGVRCALEDSPESRKRTLFAAHMLASRYNPNGFIRAWNGGKEQGWAIIDCLMNLPLLHWASRQTGDPRFALMAKRHADTAIRCFQREDGSCAHIVCFDPETGEKLSAPAGQGCAPGSSWSRGQAWALYGFTLSHALTGDPRYLDAARRVADYFVKRVPHGDIPPCDFCAPEPDERGQTVYDAAAGAIAASGLLELAKYAPAQERAAWRTAAIDLLEALDARCADWSCNTPAILTMCTAAYHDLPGRHITMTYADFFFIEAIAKLGGEPMLFWAPDL